MDAGSERDMAYNRSVIPLAEICKTCPHESPKECAECVACICSECINEGNGCSTCEAGPEREVPYGFTYKN